MYAFKLGIHAFFNPSAKARSKLLVHDGFPRNLANGPRNCWRVGAARPWLKSRTLWPEKARSEAKLLRRASADGTLSAMCS
jgi:hypothetical protein